MEPSSDIRRLIDIMAALRNPDGGCPWDLQQTFDTIAPYTIEEAYEVADAIARRDLDHLKDELGDLLLQVVYHSRLAEEIGAFAFRDVVEAVTTKMIRRHPHVFGGAGTADAAAAPGWDAIKAEERRDRAAGAPSRVLDGVPLALPALSRAAKLQRRAAAVGFDWAASGDVLAKLREEIEELEAEMASGARAERLADEIGDLLFSAVNLARHLEVDPEHAMRHANSKFSRRFNAVEDLLEAAGEDLAEAGLDRLEQAWQAVKATERGES